MEPIVTDSKKVSPIYLGWLFLLAAVSLIWVSQYMRDESCYVHEGWADPIYFVAGAVALLGLAAIAMGVWAIRLKWRWWPAYLPGLVLGAGVVWVSWAVPPGSCLA